MNGKTEIKHGCDMAYDDAIRKQPLVVQGITPAAVCHAVGAHCGYTGQKLKFADAVTKETLMHYGQCGGLSYQKTRRQCHRIMRRRVLSTLDRYAVQPVGFFSVIGWWFITNIIIKVVVALLVDWLMSRDSFQFKVNNYGKK